MKLDITRGGRPSEVRYNTWEADRLKLGTTRGGRPCEVRYNTWRQTV